MTWMIKFLFIKISLKHNLFGLKFILHVILEDAFDNIT